MTTKVRLALAVLVAVCCVATSGCLLVDVQTLASDAFEGRGAGTPGGAKAEAYLVDRLDDYALPLRTDVTGRAAYEQPFVISTGRTGTNVLGVVRGTERPDEYVMVGAHYDHEGIGGCGVGADGDRLCNGATDNATGSSAILALAERFAARPPERSVIFALWDGEEMGLLGSAAYVRSPLVANSSLIAYLNLDILGQNLLPSVRNSTFLVGAETGGPLLEQFADLVAADSTLDVAVMHEIFGRDRSDQSNFIDHGVPAMFLSDSTGPCYHHPDDEIDIVDFGKLDRQVQLAEDLVRPIADATERATFTPPTATPRYRDAVAVYDLYQRSVPDLVRFTPARQAILDGYRAQLATIVADGPDAFDYRDAVVVGNAARDSLSYTSMLACEGFLEED